MEYIHQAVHLVLVKHPPEELDLPLLVLCLQVVAEVCPAEEPCLCRYNRDTKTREVGGYSLEGGGQSW